MITPEGLTFRMRELLEMLCGLSQALVAGLADFLLVGHWELKRRGKWGNVNKPMFEVNFLGIYLLSADADWTGLSTG